MAPDPHNVAVAIHQDDSGPGEKHEADAIHNETKDSFVKGVLSEVGYQAAIDETLKEPEKPWVVFKRNPRMVLIMASVLLNGIVSGIELNMAGNMLGISAFARQFGNWEEASNSYVIPAKYISIWSAVSSPFQLFGMIFSSVAGDWIGRRPVLYFILLFCVGGAFLESFVKTWTGWLGAKIVMAFATGLMQAGVATYISEVSPRELRGISLSTFNMFMNAGNLFSVLISYGTEKTWPSVTDDRSFRVPLYICIALPVLIFACEVFLVPESPSFLIMRRKHDQARKALRWMYPRLNEEEINLKVAEIAYTVMKESEIDEENKTASFLDCFKGVDARRSFCAIFPAMSQPLCGNMLCGPYATYFFAMAGFNNSLAATAIVLSIGFACNIGVFFLIDRKAVGRWAILFYGLILMFVGDLGIGIVGSVQSDVQSSNSAQALVILFVCILTAGSVSGPGAVGWTYTGESGSMRLRAKTNTLGNLGNASIAWVMGSTISFMMTDLSLNTGYFYAGLAAMSVAIVYFFIPDYTGRSFAQVDELFERRIAPRKFASTVCTGDYGREPVVEV
ncbi:hypothetical protein SEUCBS140593_006763 [Sporothrix eucalyptigena]|uniref:Major facilitator superfamily (MFS) profile domain-containing protein n=1 Tax=Sporothrix eucalyptigena TaxID=1812306 RepID=A0ABP0C9Y2_9PEZI